MTNLALLVGGLLVLGGCASKPANSADSVKDLNKRYAEKVGVAAKAELVEEFGSADWCEQKAGGAETCRFYKSLGVQWKGDKENRKRYEAYDEIIAEFDGQGVLRDYKAKSQR